MKTNLTAAALAALLLALPVISSASETGDRATTLLALHGTVPVKNAGPYVEPGTFLIQVAVKLGQPNAKLADGTWLYRNHEIEGSNARGTLVVRFNKGRVSELSLVTPAVATAMAAPQKSGEKVLIAASK